MQKKYIVDGKKGASGLIDALLETVWLGLVFALPLVFFPNIFTTFELAKITVMKGGVIVLMLLWILKYFIIGAFPTFDSRVTRSKVRVLVLTMAIFCGFYFLSSFLSVAPALSFFGWYPRFQGLYTLFFYLLFGTIVFFELRSREQKERLVLVLCSGFLAVCACALLQKFLPGFLQWWSDSEFKERIYGTMANPNYLAGYIVMVVPLLFANIFRKKYLVLSVIGLIVGIFTLVLTLSRAGLLALLVSALFFCGFAAYQARAGKTLVALMVLPFIAGVLVWGVANNSQWLKNIPLIERLTLTEENISSARSRLQIWPAALKQIGVSPVIGFGPETFAVTFPSYAPSTVNVREDQGEIPDRAHNEILDLAVQIGIPGTAAYLCFMLGLILASGKGFLASKKNDGWLLLALGSGVLGLFAANLFGFSVTVHWVFLTLFTALILNTLGHKGFSVVRFRVNLFMKGAVFLSVAALSLAMFWIHDAKLVAADAKMREGYEALAFADFPKTAQSYAEASQLAPLQPFYALNFSYVQLQQLLEGQELSSTSVFEAYDAALHASRLRGYDGFSVSLAQELQKAF